MNDRLGEPYFPAAEDASDLIPRLYAELKRLAAARLQREPTGITLSPTALVHEAYLRISGNGTTSGSPWKSPGHFFGAAALAMRRILVERARRRRQPGALPDSEAEAAGPLWAVEARSGIDILDLNGVLPDLEAAYPRAHRVVMLRFFAGLEMEEVAQVLNLSLPTVKRDWRFARAWLLNLLESRTR